MNFDIVKLCTLLIKFSLQMSLEFSRDYIPISDSDINIIMHIVKSLKVMLIVLGVNVMTRNCLM